MSLAQQELLVLSGKFEVYLGSPSTFSLNLFHCCANQRLLNQHYNGRECINIHYIGIMAEKVTCNKIVQSLQSVLTMDECRLWRMKWTIVRWLRYYKLILYHKILFSSILIYFLAPVLVDTGMTVYGIEWNTTGSILAVSGSQRVAQQVPLISCFGLAMPNWPHLWPQQN
jgi:hypothetical protein